MSDRSADLPLTEQVRHRVDEAGISWITLNRPDVKNAISPDQRDRVIMLLAEASADLGIRAVVLGHTGDAFCTGADLRAKRVSAPRPDDAPERGVVAVTDDLEVHAKRVILALAPVLLPDRGQAPSGGIDVAGSVLITMALACLSGR